MAIEWYDPKLKRTRLICGKMVEDKENPDGPEVSCKNYPVREEEFCRFHGGMVQKKQEENALVSHVKQSITRAKDGKYATVFRRDLLHHYFTAKELDDPYSQREELALIDARLLSLAEQLSAGDNAKFFASLEEIRFSLETLISTQIKTPEETQRDITGVYVKVNEIIGEAKDERRRWDEIYQVIELRRRVVESERKRAVEAQRTLTEAQGMTMVSLILNIINRNVTDDTTRTAIATELAKFADWRVSPLAKD